MVVDGVCVGGSCEGWRRRMTGCGGSAGCGAGLVDGGVGPVGARRGAGGQAMAQLVPLWCRPRLVRRARLTAAARSVSQCRFFRAPM